MTNFNKQNDYVMNLQYMKLNMMKHEVSINIIVTVLLNNMQYWMLDGKQKKMF